jgi:hypothetical protein
MGTAVAVNQISRRYERGVIQVYCINNMWHWVALIGHVKFTDDEGYITSDCAFGNAHLSIQKKVKLNLGARL